MVKDNENAIAKGLRAGLHRQDFESPLFLVDRWNDAQIA